MSDVAPGDAGTTDDNSDGAPAADDETPGEKTPGEVVTEDETPGEEATGEKATASDAFAALGSETRMGIVRTLFAAEREAGRPVTRSFAALFEESDEETTAGFAYHLRQLPDTYLRKVEASDRDASDGAGDEAGYRLTAAGRRAARAIAAGTLTESADRDPVDLAAPCPFCAERTLLASGDDTVLTVACDACDREVLALPFPPAGYRAHDDGALPDAVDSYYRGRISTMCDGTCPECGGGVETAAELVDSNDDGDRTDGSTTGSSPTGDDAADDGHRAEAKVPVARARLSCTACGYRLRCPVALTVLDEPAIVAAFHAAGVDLGTRPLWNIGPEWRERVVSTDPLAVRVTARVGDSELACYVGRDLTVVHTDRVIPDDDGDDRSGGDAVDDDATGDTSLADGQRERRETETGVEEPGGDPDSAAA
ncbi:MAG: ArsR family transcriptional regulator [Haloglomus sp.]